MKDIRIVVTTPDRHGKSLRALRAALKASGTTIADMRKTLARHPGVLFGIPRWAVIESEHISLTKSRIAVIANTDLDEVEELLAVARNRIGMPIREILDAMLDHALKDGDLHRFRASVRAPLPKARTIQ